MLALNIEGNQQTIEMALDSFVKQYGWTSENEETQLVFAQEKLKKYIFDVVEAYNIDQARQLAASETKTELEQLIPTVTITLERAE